ncbi:2-oxo acid dehydrogenase subunit E2 [Arthrobacter sp. BHU FT2]|nr:2-oxo acid dehydrogenase subunit E2 [Arthrobacter sp. BHU FT2]
MDAATPELPPGYEDIGFEVVRFPPRRRAIARNMEAAAAIPSLTADLQVDLTTLLAVRSRWEGDRPSIMAFIAKAAAEALMEFPDLNATYTERHLIRWGTVNLSIAVDTPGGLVTPVLRDAHKRSAPEISNEIAGLAKRAHDRTLQPSDFAGGTFTLSNPGAIGPSLRAEALLNPPQVALLGLPGIRKIPVVVGTPDEERIAVRSTIAPSLTFDHRPVDGSTAVKFLMALRDRLENWGPEQYA